MSAFHPAMDYHDVILALWKAIVATAAMMVNRKGAADAHRAGGQGLPLNLALGAPRPSADQTAGIGPQAEFSARHDSGGS
jgi:hypothetical protein